ncbi:hypothetical protein CK203_068691 [Vitis vinifera]|uniref:Uncharacterized protein n=1 Tax=Vitis vinifera TaxID=29760 RepID=A0A438EE48_VITVI|nr:hypothetical protein CK203_068691 [Vitis vinifera]
MKAFATRRKDAEDQLRLRLAEAEASLSTARGENEALRADLADAKVREESMDAVCLRAANEMADLRGEKGRKLKQNTKNKWMIHSSLGTAAVMKKNGIKRDTPSIPPGDEKKLHEKLAP